ncbi:hypothetical protein IAD21_01669 [Abditibacteriota bacterium]|nr:hypothetical protein IAD21_01669 [Abditibacteriota bacterium]
MRFENLLGLPLGRARELLSEELVVIQTAPPFLPRGYTPHWGEERVLRVRALSEGKIEILVAHELVGEERAVFNDKRTAGKDAAKR